MNLARTTGFNAVRRGSGRGRSRMFIQVILDGRLPRPLRQKRYSVGDGRDDDGDGRDSFVLPQSSSNVYFPPCKNIESVSIVVYVCRTFKVNNQP